MLDGRTKIAFQIQVLESLVDHLSPIFPPPHMLLQSSRTDLPVVSPACFRRKKEFMCKVPWVLETQKHVLEKLSAWMVDFSNEKRKLLS